MILVSFSQKTELKLWKIKITYISRGMERAQERRMNKAV
jgi:hypothetical protein